MQKKVSDLKKLLVLFVVIEAAVLLAYWYFLDGSIISAALILILEAVVLYLVVDRFESFSEEQNSTVTEALGHSASDAFLFSQSGIVMYDDNHVITWMSELFDHRGIHSIGKKVLVWLPEAEALLNGSSDMISVQLDDRIYEVSRKETEPLLFFRDVTELSYANKDLADSAPVIGLASFDNYEESTQYVDDATVTAIGIAIRTPFSDYCKQHGILFKRMNASRYFLVLNEKVFNELAADRFTVLNNVRRGAASQDVLITLSLAFARGKDSYEELDETVNRLLDLAQSRGGDQVAVQNGNDEVKYFGGSSEAMEKRSKVRVRVMAHTLRDLMMRSSNVIICGHKNMDFDCMGSALGMARIATSLHKKAVIIEKTGGVEEKLKAVIEANEEELTTDVKFVTEAEALNQLQDRTLVIMVDHHNVRQSNGARVLEEAKTVAIVDHHRRSTQIGVKPVLIYIEPGASSACELITEFLPYINNHVEISELDATIMLAGMTVDTNRFRVRTGSRTYDAASALRRFGGDPQEVDEYLKDSYDEFETKAYASSLSERYAHNTIITTVKDRKLTRSLMSQVADDLLSIQNVNAVFVLSDDIEGETAISARSNGTINVQVIMEKMHGGGHMTAAAMQRPRCNIDEVEQELKDAIEEYFKEISTDESNS